MPRKDIVTTTDEGSDYTKDIDSDQCRNERPSVADQLERLYPARPGEDQMQQPVRPGKARSITIEAQDHGYVVRVGCKSFCFETVENMQKHLFNYLRDPNKVELDYLAGKYYIY